MGTGKKGRDKAGQELITSETGDGYIHWVYRTLLSLYLKFSIIKKVKEKNVHAEMFTIIKTDAIVTGIGFKMNQNGLCKRVWTKQDCPQSG